MLTWTDLDLYRERERAGRLQPGVRLAEFIPTKEGLAVLSMCFA